MYPLLVLIYLAACQGGSTEIGGKPTAPDDTDLTPSDTGTPGLTTDPPTVSGDCLVDPALSVVSATPVAGLLPTLVEVTVELSVPASVAVQCTSDLDLAEVFFAEDLTVSASHAVRLSGLLPGTSYSCSAAPTCPTQAGPATAFAYATANPPGVLERLTIEIDPVLGMGGAWTLAPFTTSPFGGDTWLVAWGPDGSARWWWPAPDGVGMWVELLWYPSEGEFVWGGGMDPQGRVRIVNLWEGETYAFAPVGWQDTEFHHDGKRLADGRLMTLEIRENTRGNDSWDGFGLRVHDPATGTVDFDYNSQRLVDDGVLPPGGGGFGGDDPWHANWTDFVETPTGPEAYVSLCFERQILAIDGDNGDLLWQLGRNLGWTILDAAGLPMSEDALPQCQHGLEVVNGTVLVYDNGQDRPRSSASEWVVDPLARTAQQIWYWSEPGWQEDYIGDIDWLPNDRVLITEATQMGESQIVEVDRATGLVASRATMADGGYTYRAERYDGCAMFTSAKACPTLAARHAEVAPLLAP